MTLCDSPHIVMAGPEFAARSAHSHIMLIFIHTDVCMKHCIRNILLRTLFIHEAPGLPLSGNTDSDQSLLAFSCDHLVSSLKLDIEYVNTKTPEYVYRNTGGGAGTCRS